jgi:hypothetical protein
MARGNLASLQPKIEIRGVEAFREQSQLQQVTEEKLRYWDIELRKMSSVKMFRREMNTTPIREAVPQTTMAANPCDSLN